MYFCKHIADKGGMKNQTARRVKVETANDRKPVMLIDYCHRTVVTVGGDRYKEVVLYKNSDGAPSCIFTKNVRAKRRKLIWLIWWTKPL